MIKLGPEEAPEGVIEEARKEGYNTAFLIGTWRGKKVYGTYMGTVSDYIDGVTFCTGLPCFIIDNDGQLTTVSGPEAMGMQNEIIDCDEEYVYEDEEDNNER